MNFSSLVSGIIRVQGQIHFISYCPHGKEECFGLVRVTPPGTPDLYQLSKRLKKSQNVITEHNYTTVRHII